MADKPLPQFNTRLLIVGAILGLLLAATGLLNQPVQLDKTAAAIVNGKLISKQDYLNYLSLLAKDKRNPLTDNDRRHILNRMIEEQLLVARGIDIGLAESRTPKKNQVTD
eukprot:TRINITY_DN8201_c0_g1_i1.p1 TRINITY_DN8201_c0_g1~~TRINITY_DN8201_c0_g1_i1.p1  ORF type:complete len:110 (+),score=7.49 TRINITY_DN8201_c0_g1_i1:174-503(+)